jgi:hypothetical protein
LEADTNIGGSDVGGWRIKLEALVKLSARHIRYSKFRQALVMFITMCNIAFSVVES